MTRISGRNVVATFTDGTAANDAMLALSRAGIEADRIWAVLHAARTMRGEEDLGRLELALAGETTRPLAAASAIAGTSAGVLAMFAVTAAGALAVMGAGGTAPLRPCFSPWT